MILIRLINPHNSEPLLLPDGSGRKIYATEVTNNLPFALQVMSAVYLAIGLVGIALMAPPETTQQSALASEDTLKGSMLSVESQ
jgi:hypothetical protein